MSPHNKKKYFTLMLVPHTGAKVRTLKIPWILIKAAICFLLGVVVATGYFYNDYGHVRSYMPELDHLRVVNEEQQQEIEELADKTVVVQEKLSKLEQLENEIRLLLEGEASSDSRIAAVVASRSGDRSIREEIPAAAAAPREISSSAEADPRLNVLHNVGAAPHEIDKSAAGNLAYGGYSEAVRPDSTIAVEHTLESVEKQIERNRENFQDLIGALEERNAYLDAKPSLWPTQGRITSHYGYRLSPFTRRREFHEGIDIAAPRGTPVVATGSGIVTFADWRSGYGRTVIIDHGYGYKTLYAHNTSFAVQQGTKVEKGQVVAYVGSTGHSTGPHVHYEVYLNGVTKNPIDYIP